MSESIIVGLTTFFLGLLLGHRMTLWRERRKEFNEVAARIRVALKARKGHPSPYLSNSEKIVPTDMELFEHLLGARKRAKFRQAWESYVEECKRREADELGQPYYQNPEAVVAALDRMLPFTSLR